MKMTNSKRKPKEWNGQKNEMDSSDNPNNPDNPDNPDNSDNSDNSDNPDNLNNLNGEHKKWKGEQFTEEWKETILTLRVILSIHE